MKGEDYLIEFRQVGAVVRVTAIDPKTGKEAVIQGPVSAEESALAAAVIRKLEYLLGKADRNTR
jgi:hypothetical protein